MTFHAHGAAWRKVSSRVALVAVGLAVACSAATDPADDPPSGATGGAAGLPAAGGGSPGGVQAAGGGLSSGGAFGSGGSAGSQSAGGSSAGGAEGSGGAQGTGGAPPPGDCPVELLGWASMPGDGVDTTTGGGSAPPVRPSTAAELMAYASDGTPRVIEIAGVFDVPRLQVASNKTLVGIGSTATINGGIRIRGAEDALVSNVIVRNLRVNGATTDVDDDAVQIYFAHHVWLDHLEIWDGPDGNLDMTHAVNWVTVSWTKFRYTSAYQRPPGESSDHRFSSLVGHSDDNSGEDAGRLKVTFHHDWWADGVIERMPRVRYGQVHVASSYFASPGNNYCIRAGRAAALLVEGNYFDGVENPHEFNDETDRATAHITVRGNEYDGATGERAEGGGGPPFAAAPYAFTVEPAAGIPERVRACAGPR